MASSRGFSAAEVASIRGALLSWYSVHGSARGLPWRAAEDASVDSYGVLVSEIMLQQTRADVVTGYWKRWMAQFPTLSALSAAPEAAVLSAWAGLGYYSRARRLLAAAQACVAATPKGAVPALPVGAAALRALPGVGPYTAGAVASIAQGEAVAAVDGNVIRVLARLRARAEPATAPALVKDVWAMATALVDGPRPGALNQALMDLGATICTPRSPACGRCPLLPTGTCMAATAAAAAAGTAADIEDTVGAMGRFIDARWPGHAEKKAARRRDLVAVVALCGGGKFVWLTRDDSSGGGSDGGDGGNGGGVDAAVNGTAAPARGLKRSRASEFVVPAASAAPAALSKRLLAGQLQPLILPFDDDWAPAAAPVAEVASAAASTHRSSAAVRLDISEGTAAEAAVLRRCLASIPRFGELFSCGVSTLVGVVSHVFSHEVHRLHVVRVESPGSPPPPLSLQAPLTALASAGANGAWWPVSSLGDAGLTTYAAKALFVGLELHRKPAASIEHDFAELRARWERGKGRIEAT